MIARTYPDDPGYTSYTTSIPPRRMYAWAVLRDHKTKKPAGLWGPVPWRGRNYVGRGGLVDPGVIVVDWPEWTRRGVTLNTDRIIIAPAPTLRDPSAVANVYPIVTIGSGITLQMNVSLAHLERDLWPELVVDL